MIGPNPDLRAKAAPVRRLKQGKITGCGHNFASRTGDQVRNWDGDFMLRKNLASSRLVRVGVFGLFTIAAAVVFTTDSAEARRHHGIATRPSSRPSQRRDRDSYSPQFSSIIVDGNSGATLAVDQPGRHPPSGIAHQDHDALSAVRASRRRQDEARHRDAGFGTRRRSGSDQARPASRTDHPRRRRDQGSGDALGQRCRRRHRGSDRRRRRRFRQDDDAQGACARHEPDHLSQRLRPAQ